MKTILILYLILLSTFIYSQNIKVVDNNTQKGIENVIISSQSKTILTNKNGEADISAFKNATKISFSHASYKTQIISYKKIESKDFTIQLIPNIVNVDEIVVSANKFEEKLEDIPRQIEVISSTNIAKDNPQNSADMLQESGDIFVQKSQMGGGSPIIRGFETNKILLIVDGVRLNNAIYRGGHLQNIITVDESMLQRTEVVYGPGSVVYGSDALGGVIHLFTRNPELSLDTNLFISGKLYSRYATANNEQSSHFDLNIGGKKFASLTSASIHSFGDLRQGANRLSEYPDFGKCNYFASRYQINDTLAIDTMIKNPDVNIQKRSGYMQYDVMQKFLYAPGEKTKHLINIQYSTTGNIPRDDRLSQYKDTVLKYADWYYGPQNRFLSSYNFESKKQTKFYDNMRLILAYQKIEESRHSRKFGSDELKHRTEKLDIGSVNIDFAKIVKKNELRYGFESQYNYVKSQAESQNILTDSVSPLNTRYPDGGSQMYSAAVYATHTWEINDIFLLNDGIRYSYTDLSCKFIDKNFYDFSFDNISQKNSAINGNLGLVVKAPHKFYLSVNLSSGFKAPNVDDVSKVFDSQPGSVIVPNNNLKPEYAYTGEFNVSKIIDKKLLIKLNSFYTIYKDAITTQPFLFNGQDSIMYDGTLSRVFANVNAKNAYIYGFSGKLITNITSNITLNSSVYYTYGRIKTDTVDYPLDHIPPIYGRTGISYEKNNLNVEFFSLYNGWKHLKDYNLYGEDNFSKATADGMPSWYTINFAISYRINKYLLLQSQVKNILDRNYRIFASGISAPGRNFIFTLRISF